ncbi:MAG: integration host factor subunit alpha [Thermodesulfovibrionales bacterium]|nr:integration host factor subunit alpha [Thermodesulfovibrionales bacterium]
MTKVDLISVLYEKVGLPKKEAQEIVETLFETIKETLIIGETIKISGFGTFYVRKKGARKGRNPKTLQEVEIKPRKVITFKVSDSLKKSINKA